MLRLIVAPTILLLAICAISCNKRLFVEFAFFLFIFAAVLDFADGMLARALKAESVFGEVLDPIADKMLVAFGLIAILIQWNNTLDQNSSQLLLITLAVCAIISRDMIIAGMREFAREKSVSLKPSRLAKAKTTIELVAIAILLCPYTLAIPQKIKDMSGVGLLLTAATLSLYTGVIYIRNLKRGS